MTGTVGHLSGPGFDRLWPRCRRALERSGGIVGGTVSLPEPTDEERRVLGGLLRRHLQPGGARLTVRLDALDVALRAGPAALGLPEVVEQLTGPLRNRPAEAAAATAEIVAARAVVADQPGLAPWIDSLAADGILTRLQRDGGLHLVGTAAAVLAQLPADGVPLSVLAGRTAGSAKALDGGALPTLVLRALALAGGVATPISALGRRRLWDAHGVVMDPLSSQVLVLGLGESNDGEPRRWTLRQLRGSSVPAAPVLWVCENPAVVAVAADRLGAACPPLLCTEGQPSTAARAVVGAAAQVRWHNDWDWPGVRMTAAAVERHGARPWRMSAEAYEAAVRATDPTRLRPLAGRPAPTPWEPALARAMAAHGVTLEEELVVDALVADLSRAWPGGAAAPSPRR